MKWRQIHTSRSLNKLVTKSGLNFSFSFQKSSCLQKKKTLELLWLDGIRNKNSQDIYILGGKTEEGRNWTEILGVGEKMRKLACNIKYWDTELTHKCLGVRWLASLSMKLIDCCSLTYWWVRLNCYVMMKTSDSFLINPINKFY